MFFTSSHIQKLGQVLTLMTTINDTISQINAKADAITADVSNLRNAIQAYIAANPQADVTGLQNALDKVSAAQTAVEDIITTIPVI